MIKCLRESNENKVCEILSKFHNNWNLNVMFLRVTHGPGGYTIFYDEKLEIDPRNQKSIL